MSRPLVVSIPHNLGREAALKRIRDGIGQIRTSYAAQMTVLEETWTGDRLDFSIMALKQTVSGSIDVAESTVTVSVMLPLFLSMLAEKAKGLIQQRGQLMLDKK
jgi:hypothetical protein